uniref:Arginine biosynthesis bifunctional protein ArgJ, mitochondrial n=1 Tax=Chromera velia CCMP2878 TaxID=1169474 RepID=A0A0G4HXN6_9ALVE|eukprot:Cvel_33200.t1-p1 / transcript=Cvel_33200.t1 / gene=Cvel_33200 / organism=Chromera_velia_CCMP2878 / gene_product=Arginine biosynthesis bifunctional protein ArgJ,, putative / transcript_product=Arginine biosynthesis bifunctional protein ArgJ,, putative / location=Cvel_scaffold5331:103-5033(-) / protein_length=460 / sequence_SO=supercontig / SO=protein_coding / is_pseudo=false
MRTSFLTCGLLFYLHAAWGFRLVRQERPGRPGNRATILSSTQATHNEAVRSRFYEALESIELPEGVRVGVRRGLKFVPAVFQNQEGGGAGKDCEMNMSMLLLDSPSPSFAAVFTRNAVCGHPVTIGKERLRESEKIRAVVVNNKVSNVGNRDGLGNSERLCEVLAEALPPAECEEERASPLDGPSPCLQPPAEADEIIPCSTGVIGWELPIDEMVDAVPSLVESLSPSAQPPPKFSDFAKGIMTSDNYPKAASREVDVGGGEKVLLCGAAKGAGMIEPNMATMLAFVVTDANLEREEMQTMLQKACDASFNCASVDSDQSTSDSLIFLSSRKKKIPGAGREQVVVAVAKALKEICVELAGHVVRNGEGVQHVIEVNVEGCRDDEQARTVGKAVVNSPLFKAAVAGNDPNIGRLASAIGSAVGKMCASKESDGEKADAAARAELEKMSIRIGDVSQFALLH